MITNNINFKNFKIKKDNKKIKKDFELLLKENNTILKSLSTFYENSYTDKKIQKFKKYTNIKIIGMGGSILGAESIYEFLKDKIKKNFYFINNLKPKIINDNKKNINLIISKSGNTLETISNLNVHLKKKDKNIFITESKNSYLATIAKKLKAEIIHHNDFIGGRYSVLSEVGMLPV